MTADSEIVASFFAGRVGSSLSLPRVDSDQELQFQELLRQIPSSSHLESPPGGVPRVPSLDFIRAFLNARQTTADGSGAAYGSPPLGPRTDPCANAAAPAQLMSQGKLDALLGSPAPGRAGSSGLLLQAAAAAPSGQHTGAPPPPQQGAELAPGALAAALAQGWAACPAAAHAVAAMQGGAAGAAAASAPRVSAPTSGLAGTSEGAGTSDAGQAAGADPCSRQAMRKARRMLSNRESARRSRKRKQDHMATMEAQLAAVEGERSALAARCACLEADLAAARADVERLRAGERAALHVRSAVRARGSSAALSNAGACDPEPPQ